MSSNSIKRLMLLNLMTFLLTGTLLSYAEEKRWYDMKKQTAVPLNWSREYIRTRTDSASGAKIIQLTSGPANSTNVYPEQRFTSADGSRIIIQREPFNQQSQVWMCDLKKKKILLPISEGKAVTANHRSNAIYYIVKGDKETKLMRLDIKSLTTCEVFTFPKGECPRKFAVSADERWIVCGPFKISNGMFSLKRIDLATGKIEVLCKMKDIWNPHLQGDPGNPDNVLVQINRKGSLKGPRTGPLGATLAVVNVKSGKVTPLPVGAPDTPLISGHEAWIGKTGSILFCVAPGGVPEHINFKGVYKITPGDKKAVQLTKGLPFNHIGISDDGRYFIVDDYKTWRIYVGSVKTGRYLELCDSKTIQGSPQYTHAHPYMTPDNKYVIYNSIATGLGQVYAAKIPKGFLEKIDSLKAIK